VGEMVGVKEAVFMRAISNGKLDHNTLRIHKRFVY
jgi:hypothetical protein